MRTCTHTCMTSGLRNDYTRQEDVHFIHSYIHSAEVAADDRKTAYTITHTYMHACIHTYVHINTSRV